MPEKIYLAGPFFNPRQIEIVSNVEQALTFYEIPHFSPRKQDDNDAPETSEGLTPEKAARIFEKDYVNIKNCTCVIAILDFALPEGKRCTLVDDTYWRRPSDSGNLTRRPSDAVAPFSIKVPDTGTVWEMGAAYAMGKPIYAFTQDPSNRLNLMLSQSCQGIIYGWARLNRFISTYPENGTFNTHALQPWKGDHR
jgi:nucleoside 2-deoxyribosyltransferase